MTIEDILSGESRNIEFKEELPDKSIKYMKSVVAFANGNGGKIIFGIADQTRNVVGVHKEMVFKIMDAIANAISDSCEPAIIPDISLQTLEGKTIIVVEIAAGRQRPYYIKSLGKEAGVYVRVAGTTRLADEYMVKELMFEGSSRHFDQALCFGLDITDEDVDTLCRAMKEQAIKNVHSEEQKTLIKDIGRQQLRSWGILMDQDGKDYPTNAYAILTGCEMFPVAMQCGVFKGTTREIFVDRRQYDGPIWEQIEQAYQFVLRNIHMGAKFEGIYRQDIYEIPPDAIRELIINAAVHRSYLDHGNIQIAIYDNRLEVTSPGKLPMGQTLERMKEGYSQIRNEALASAFAYMNLIEHWGSGIPRIIGRVRAAGLEEPEFIGGEVDLRINIYRNRRSDVNSYQFYADNSETADRLPENCRETAGKLPENCRKLTGKLPSIEQERIIYMYIQEHSVITTTQAAKLLGVKQRRARDILSGMVERHWITKQGASRSTTYVIETEERKR